MKSINYIYKCLGNDTEKSNVCENFRVRCKMEHAETFELEHSRIRLENIELKNRLFVMEKRLTFYRSLINRYNNLVRYIYAQLYILKDRITDLENKNGI